MTELHEKGVLRVVDDRSSSVDISLGNDGAVGVLVKNGIRWASIILSPSEAIHLSRVIDSVCANVRKPPSVL